jgi:hypothetical protein
MEMCIRIGYDSENEEFYVEAYGSNSEHLGSLHFKKWSQVLCFLWIDYTNPKSAESWLRQISSEEVTNEEMKYIVSKWPNHHP